MQISFIFYVRRWFAWLKGFNIKTGRLFPAGSNITMLPFSAVISIHSVGRPRKRPT